MGGCRSCLRVSASIPRLTQTFLFEEIFLDFEQFSILFLLKIRTPQLFTMHFCLNLNVILLLMDVSKIADRVANSADPDQTPRSAASDLGLHCLPRTIGPNTFGKYGCFYKIEHYSSFEPPIK